MSNEIKMFVQNNTCLIFDDGSYQLKSFMDSTFTTEVEFFQARRGGRGKFVTESAKIYDYMTFGNTNFYSIPRGALAYIPDELFSHIELKDTSYDTLKVPSLSYSEVATILQPESGFNLRKDQVYGVNTGLQQKRGILQYPTGCLFDNQEILLSNGSWVPIIDLVNDKSKYPNESIYVKSYDTETNTIVDSVLIDAYKTKDSQFMTEIILVDGTTINCTFNHPILVYNSDCDTYEYMDSVSINYNDIIVNGLNSLVAIKSIKLKKVTNQSVYDLSVDHTHSFITRSTDHEGSGIVVHNSGKTEIMSGILKSLISVNHDLVHALVMVPTSVLRDDTAKRFRKYNIDAVPYNDSRMDLSHEVTVAHVSALLNDLNKNPELLSGINVMIKDEVQHSKSETYMKLERSIPNAEYNLGMSALAVDSSHIENKAINQFDLDEANIIGSTGPVLVNIPPKYYIDNGILAKPVVFQLYSEGDVDNPDHRRMWQKLQSEVLNSDEKVNLISDVTNKFHSWNRKILILVNTKKLGDKLAKGMIERYDGMNGRVGIRYGNGESYIANQGINKFSKDSQDEDVLDKFARDELDVIIATSVLDEGVDIKNLDVLIMAGSGKKDRRIMQRIGRVLRKTKNGKYAYVVDFSDDGPTSLKAQSNMRLKMYRDLVGIDERYIFASMTMDRVDYEFHRLEGD